MNSYYFLASIVMCLAILVTTPSAFAATVQVIIMPGSGSGEYCEQTSTCFNPSLITLHPGDAVIWTNHDNVAHSLTDGMPFSGQTGALFSSGPIGPMKTYSFTFQDSGDHRYFATDSKWMVGEIIVNPSSASSTVPEFGSMTTVILVSIIGMVILTRFRR